MTRALQKTDVWEKFLLFLGRRRGIAVAGDSMAPTLRDGDVVLVGAAVGLAEGDIVLARHPFKRSIKMLKRIDRIDEHDRFWLVGDNPPESSDSRFFGAVPRSDLLGKATSLLRSNSERKPKLPL